MKEKSKSTAEEGLTRRSFMKGGAGAVIAASCLHNLRASPSMLKAHVFENAAAKTYICPPCGLPCDKLTFDKPGNCPNCGMTLVPLDGEGGPPKVAILVFNGAELIDFAGPWEVFGTAGFLVHTVAETPESLTLVFGQKMIPDYTFENAPKAAILLVPGGGVFGYLKNEKLIGWIQDKSKQVSHVISVCTGAFLLGQAGLLSGQKATCTSGMIEDLAGFPNTQPVYGVRYVDSGKVITTGGLSSGIDGAIHLLSKMLGKGEAQRVALAMEYRWDPDAKWARSAMADKYLPAKLKGAEAKIISTEGDTDHWETEFLVSQPGSSVEIVALLRQRIAAHTASGGMYKPVSHMRGAPVLSTASANDSKIRWKFTDDQGRDWSGLGLVEPAPDDKSKFIATLKIARQS